MNGRLRRDVLMYQLTAGNNKCPRPSRFFFNLEGQREGEENVTMPVRLATGCTNVPINSQIDVPMNSQNDVPTY